MRPLTLTLLLVLATLAPGVGNADDTAWHFTVAGARGYVIIAKSPWRVPYQLDIGTGSSEFTWQGVAGIAYALNSFDLSLLYRHIYFGSGGDHALIQDLSLSGPALGAAFSF